LIETKATPAKNGVGQNQIGKTEGTWVTLRSALTRIGDVALLCADCQGLFHRAIATKKSWIDVDEGRKLLL
jgi:hypothetical protein